MTKLYSKSHPLSMKKHLVGYKGKKTQLDAGYFYCPYIPPLLPQLDDAQIVTYKVKRAPTRQVWYSPAIPSGETDAILQMIEDGLKWVAPPIKHVTMNIVQGGEPLKALTIDDFLAKRAEIKAAVPELFPLDWDTLD